MGMKRIIALAFVISLAVGVAVIAVPPLTAGPVYTVPQVLPGLTPRNNAWGGRTVWVRGVAVLGYELGEVGNTVNLYGHTSAGSLMGFRVSVKPPNLAFTILTWKAWIAHHVPGMGWLYGTRPGVYRIRFFQPTWCMSCSVGQLE